MLNYNEGRAILLHHWCRLVRPEDIAVFTDTGVDYWEHQQPSLAERGYIKRVYWERELPSDLYIAHQLAYKGGKFLVEHFDVPEEEITIKRKPVSPSFIRHELQVTKDTLTLWNSDRELFRPLVKLPPVMADVVHEGRRYRFWARPDGIFTMSPPEYDLAVEYLETDMGKESIYPETIRGFVSKGNIYRKCLVYLAALKRAYREGRPLFRVRFVTTSRDRVFNMIGELWPRLAEKAQLDTKGGDDLRDFIIFNSRDILKADSVTTWCNLAGGGVENILPET